MKEEYKRREKRKWILIGFENFIKKKPFSFALVLPFFFL